MIKRAAVPHKESDLVACSPLLITLAGHLEHAGWSHKRTKKVQVTVEIKKPLCASNPTVCSRPRILWDGGNCGKELHTPESPIPKEMGPIFDLLRGTACHDSRTPGQR
ncbi:hypothetical protein CPC08DRAFT_170121 [Agrocybe pediades]|nr:hypothetical protein CPC08DRAFT_170121 [Agrocybe pediades]